MTVDMSTLRLEIIGPPRLTIDGDERPLPSPKRLLVLCYLVLERRAVTRPRLVDLFWPDLDESRGRAALRSTLAAIRAEVGGEVLITKADTVAAAGIDSIDTDLERLGRDIDGRGPEDPKLVPLIEPVAERGNCDFMVRSGADGSPELEDWLAATAHRVNDDHQPHVHMLTSALSARGDTLSALEYARKWVACKPGSTAAVKQLMTLPLALSRDAEAARCFEEHRAHVGDRA
jgi:DNA-binding SARP family transcriptional activator